LGVCVCAFDCKETQRREIKFARLLFSTLQNFIAAFELISA